MRANELQKLEVLEFAIKHWRHNNPDSYIILAGHGLKPNATECDFVHWEKEINERDINVGHPRLCNIAYDHAKAKGFTKVLKSRADSIHLLKNICSQADTLLKDKKMLVTQQTSLVKQELGDLFLYGSTALMKKMFNINNWYPTKSGLNSLANNFMAQCDEDSWRDACVNNLQLVDIFKLRWVDFRSNWDFLKDHQTQLMNFTLDNEHEYYWGAKEKWHMWNISGECISKLKHVATEKEWYR